MKVIKFSEIKEELQKALNEKLRSTPITGEAGFNLIEGFMTMPLQGEISNNVIIGGPSIPVVGIVGTTSGRIYTFALKAVMPSLEI